MRPISGEQRVMPARWPRALAATAVAALAFAGLMSTGNANAAGRQPTSTPTKAAGLYAGTEMPNGTSQELQKPTRPTPAPPTAPTIPEPSDSDIGDVPVVGPDTEWRYWDDDTDPAEGLGDLSVWAQPEFDDSNWKVGKGSFGSKYGALNPLDGGYIPNTLLKQYKEGGDGDTKVNTEAFFFRTQFELSAADLDQIEALTGTIIFDDAARLYVNGSRAGGYLDSRIDEAPSTNMVYAGDGRGAPTVDAVSIPRELLREGVNTLAIQLHNTSSDSSDIYLDLSDLHATAGNPPLVISDVVLTVGADETQRNVTFYTDREIAGQVQFAKAADRIGDDFPVDSATVVDATTKVVKNEVAPKDRYSHQATMSGLEENTAYIYRLGSDETGWSRSYETWTGTFDSTYSLVFLGDIQIGIDGTWEDDRDRWAAAAEKIAQQEPDASMVMSAGDQIDNYWNENEYASLFAPALMQEQPFVPTIGNHDSASKGFDTHFFTPNRSEEHGYLSDSSRSGGDYWYTYNGVLYLNLNSNARSEGEQDHIAFMEDVIAEHGDEANWIVATWHHSLYSAAYHSRDQDVIERREALAPAMSKLGVDLVLSGHDHTYARSYLMNGTEPVGDLAEQEELGAVLYPEDGEVLYLAGNSSSGSKFYSLDPESPDVAVKKQTYEPQYTNVEVSPSAITLTTRHTFDETVIDQVTIAKAINEPPQILGVEEATTVNQGQPFDALFGVTAIDAEGADLTSSITVDGTVDIKVPGTYTLTYSVTDASGAEATAVREVTVVAVPPTISGVLSSRTIAVGSQFNPLEGVKAVDANGVDLSGEIEVTVGGKPFASSALTVGTHTLTYRVTDSYGSSATASSVVSVVAQQVVDGDKPGGDKPGKNDGVTTTQTKSVTSKPSGLASTGASIGWGVAIAFLLTGTVLVGAARGRRKAGSAQ